ncbi:hypothetical protein Tco_1555087 [Tanacetum coccineum]
MLSTIQMQRVSENIGCVNYGEGTYTGQDIDLLWMWKGGASGTFRVETVDEETKIIAKVNGRQRTVIESSASALSMESTPKNIKPLSKPIPKATTLPSQSHPDISTPRRLTRGAIRISQSKAPTPRADETASPTRDDKHGEAFPTATSLDARHDRENIAKTSAMPMKRFTDGFYFSCKKIQSTRPRNNIQLKNKFKTLADNEKEE